MGALDTLLATQQAPNVLGAFNQGIQNRNKNALQAFELEQAPIIAQRQAQLAQEQSGLRGQQSQLNEQKIDAGGRQRDNDLIVKTADFIGDVTNQAQFIQLINQIPFLDDEAKQNAIKFGPDGVRRAAQGIRQQSGQFKSAGQREFESLTEGLTEDEAQEAKLVKLGLSPRAVGSAIQTIADEGNAELIGDTEATIAQRKKFAELTGASRAKSIDKGFNRIIKIDLGIKNIDRAIDALKGGAKTGAIERFLPSIRAASVELEQIRSEMALDVVGATTFGALSKGELDLAKDVALPKGLNEPELIAHLEKRKDAQIKLRGYFQEQIDFLDQGGSVAGFLRKKEKELGRPQAQPEAANVGRFQIEVVQ